MKILFSIIFIGYFLYYLVNIIYDMFFKRDEQAIFQDDVDEFSFEEDLENGGGSIHKVTVEDVNGERTKDFDFEEKEHLNEEVSEEQQVEEQQSNIDEVNREERRENNRKESEDRFKEIMKLAESNVQLVNSFDGQKVYQSVYNFN